MSEKEDLNDLSLKQLECPICLEYCTPPIVQCSNGHNVCSKCRPRIVDCPVCKAKMTDVRNLFAEQISSRLKYPCKFAGNGCGERIVLKEMEDHLAVCSYVIRCQLKAKSAGNARWYIPCTWLGSNFELGNHIKDAHDSKTFVTDFKTLHSFPLRRRIDVRLLSTQHQYFWSYLVYNFKTSTMRCMVFCIGSSDKASRFVYQFQLVAEDGLSCVVNRGNVVSSHECNAMLEEYFTPGKDGKVEVKWEHLILVQGKDFVKRFIHGDNDFKCRVVISLKTKPRNASVWKELSEPMGDN